MINNHFRNLCLASMSDIEGLTGLSIRVTDPELLEKFELASDMREFRSINNDLERRLIDLQTEEL